MVRSFECVFRGALTAGIAVLSIGVATARAGDCGGPRPCSCGDRVVESTILAADLGPCPRDGLRVVAPSVCRPFSKNRQGLIIGEGAAIYVLERPDHARARGAKAHGHLVGGAMTSDAGDLTTPDGVGMPA